MRYYDIMGLSLGQIKTFLCCVESESFSAAAKKLHFTQSMVSKTIAGLEKALGLILFIRQKNRSVPTPAARILYEGWQEVFEKVESSVERAHVLQEGLRSVLTVGCADTMIEHDGLTDAFREFCATHPETAFQYNEYLMSDMLDMAGRRELDVIITTQFDAAALIDAGYNCKVLTLSSISIFMPLTNPLSERESIAISDLCTEQFIVLSPARNPNYISLLKDLCAQSGFEPRISTYVTSAHSFKVNLLMNQGIVLADNYTDIHHSGIKKFEIEGINYSEVIAWREDSSEAKALIRIIDKHFHSSAR